MRGECFAVFYVKYVNFAYFHALRNIKFDSDFTAFYTKVENVLKLLENFIKTYTKFHAQLHSFTCA